MNIPKETAEKTTEMPLEKSAEKKKNHLKLLSYVENTPIDVSTLPEENIWLRILGIKDAAHLQEIGGHYLIHELIMEDILNADHQPKFEFHNHYTLFILKTFHKNTDKDDLETVQFSIIFGQNFLITFEEQENAFVSKYFETMQNAFKKTPSVERIVYDLMDNIVDHYLECAYDYQEKIDLLENKVILSNESYDLNALFNMRREIHTFKRIIRPMQDIIERQSRAQYTSFSEGMAPYLKDLWDHTNKAAALGESMWETLVSLHSEILTHLQYRLSRTMNIMTTVSVIFLPLMVITGIYGMNFDIMPELHFKYSYPFVLLFMLCVGAGMFTFFKLRKFF